MARTTNNSASSIGVHMTLTKIINDDERAFGFAITDEGQEVFIPGPVIKAANMTAEEGELGAGITCPVRNNLNPEGTARLIANNPAVFDGGEDEPEYDLGHIIEKLHSAFGHLEDENILNSKMVINELLEHLEDAE